MVIRERDRAIARSSFRVAVGIIERRHADVADIARAALEHPGPITVRALLHAGNGKPWQHMLIEALAEAGIAAAEDVLGGADVVEYELRRDPGESDEDYERRRHLLGGGRIVIGVDELSQDELEAIANSEIPEELRWSSDDEGDDE
ncbi:hypothetical protein [Devosia salina]|uniref:Uncharacterized protein n=1 Tax=Devosia salina TaxID=2860336 RepID=A0ABX8WPE9_9HYPH|nr:hypothetical protein [Devosia salina]QYO78335.1 hypothetical protein K1X15_07235 [Devosia salina]